MKRVCTALVGVLVLFAFPLHALEDPEQLLTNAVTFALRSQICEAAGNSDTAEDFIHRMRQTVTELRTVLERRGDSLDNPYWTARMQERMDEILASGTLSKRCDPE
jgi:hypothetical protein